MCRDIGDRCRGPERSSAAAADKSIRRAWHDGQMDQAAEKADSLELVAAPAIEKRIFAVLGRQVMLDEDLADLYGVETRVLVQQVKRNAKRFPGDFMFQLTSAEAEVLRSQIVISNEGRGGRRYAPYVFTEQGIAMLSGVLRSDRAIAVWFKYRPARPIRPTHPRRSLSRARSGPRTSGNV